MENNILSVAAHNRAAFDQLEKYKVSQDLSDQGQILWKIFRNYYNKDNDAQNIDKNILKQIVEHEVPKHSSLFNTLIDSFELTSIPNLLHAVIEQRKERNTLEMTQALSSNKDEIVSELWVEREMLLAGDLVADDNNEILIAPELGEIFAARSMENRINVYPPALNTALEGGALPGHHIVIFAVTDLGKTLFSLNMIRGFIEQGKKVLLVCNEDPVSDLIERFLVSLTGRDKHQIRRHPERAQHLAEKKGWSNLIWAELSPGTLGEIRSLIEEHKPDILVVDQIRNLNTGDKDFVRILEKAAQGMRNFAKQYNLVAVSITQAADSANGKAILGRGDIDNSNVGIPGTADLMMGIGATQEQEFDGVRTLSFPKNKISGNKQPIQCFFNNTNMRVE
jgi:archaellum biogenesis ATPase FlaH